MKFYFLTWLLSVWAMSFGLLVITSVKAQSKSPAPGHLTICPLGQRPVPNGLTVRSVKILGRRGVGPIEEKLRAKWKLNTPEAAKYTSKLHDEAMDEVETALTNETNKAFEQQTAILGGATTSSTGVAALRLVPCVEVDLATQTVEVIVKVQFLRADLGNIANNLLTLPRSLAPSFYDKMPIFLRAFHPQVNFAYDRRIGPVAALSLSTNLVDLLKGKVSNSHTRMDLKFEGATSMSKRFYETRADLTLSKARPSQLVEELDFTAGFSAAAQPLDERRYVNSGLQLSGQVKLRPRAGFFNSIYLSGRYSRKSNKVYDQSQRVILTDKDNRGSFNSLIDGRLWNGFARLGVWVEGTGISRTSTNYQRLAGLFGYQTEVGKDTQTIGIETIIGGGKAWGAVPPYARFFGGNNAGSFLYESPASGIITSFPVGPLLRSYGKTQAAVPLSPGVQIGGKSYWHANLNITIPIRAWSRPLIPDETVPLPSGDKKLNQILEDFTVGSAIGGIAGDLLDPLIDEMMKQDPSLDEDAALKKAQPIARERATRIVNKEIAPTMRFIAHRANLYAFKPLIMLDAARIGGDSGRARTRFSLGGGLQFVIVIARAEFGYVRSVPTITGESKGNFVFRLTFQNFF